MVTIKQEQTAKARLEHPEANKTELVALGGYGPAVRKHPARALNSKGYKEALKNYGLTEALIRKSLVNDIKAKPKNRVRELNLGAEILGMKESENRPQDITVNLGVVVLPARDATAIQNRLGANPEANGSPRPE